LRERRKKKERKKKTKGQEQKKAERGKGGNRRRKRKEEGEGGNEELSEHGLNIQLRDVFVGTNPSIYVPNVYMYIHSMCRPLRMESGRRKVR